jgi:hypothetical protein
MAKLRDAKSGKFLTHTCLGRSAVSSFCRGFVDGVGGVAATADSTKMSYRTYKGRGLRGDWVAVGNSIRRAKSAS